MQLLEYFILYDFLWSKMPCQILKLTMSNAELRIIVDIYQTTILIYVFTLLTLKLLCFKSKLLVNFLITVYFALYIVLYKYIILLTYS